MQENTEMSVLAEAPAEGDLETQLSKRIGELWSAHTQVQTSLGHTKEELRVIRLELGQRLYEWKLALVCPGRAGQWRKFLSEHGIPRATADRYAKAYERTLDPTGEIASRESSPLSPGETLSKVLRSIWPKLRQIVTDKETAYQFVWALVQRCDTLQVEITDLGIAIRKPTTINSEASPASLEANNAVG